jgi:hypothetical protein
MVAAKKPFNPFYGLLVVVGIAFVITACAYGVLTVKMLQPSGATEIREATTGLLPLLDRHGMTILLSEIGVLAVLTFAAIGTDEYWQRRSGEPGTGNREPDAGS